MPKKKAASATFLDVGKKYGKPDIERIGIFIEAPYLIGRGYVSPFEKPAYFKGLNMLSEGRKTKCGTQHGYFDTQFKRLFEGERAMSKKPKAIAKPTIPFMPTGPSKWIATPGDYYGCFSGIIEHFSNVRRPVPKYKTLPSNFMTNPVKMGGCGYADICLSKYPTHLPDPYKPKGRKKEKDAKLGPPMITCHYPQAYFHHNPYVDPSGNIGPTYIRPRESRTEIGEIFLPTGPSKKPGGCHAGCFSLFPTWKPERPKKKKRKGVVINYFYPQSMALKSMNTVSTLQRSMDFRINATNNTTYEPTFTKHLLD
ncbi:hypothetical protein Trydic_g15046 [Trypoxylus dichotomus]